MIFPMPRLCRPFSALVLSLASLCLSNGKVCADDDKAAIHFPADTITTVKIDTADIHHFDWYKARYPYMGNWGKVFTIESEFLWPAGAVRPDSATLTPYQFWVSNMPLWHFGRGVSSIKQGAVYPPAEISRAISFPWRTQEFTDRAIPFQMVAEFLLASGHADQLRPIVRAGDTLDYRLFLKSSYSYGSRQNIIFSPAPPRRDTITEFNAFFNLIAVNTTYASLIRNADSISIDDLLPGDLIVAQDAEGTHGTVHIVLTRLNRPDGEKFFLLGTGCDFACDFHIPLFNGGRRDFPWLTPEQLTAIGQGFPRRGAYRLRLP